MACLPEGETAGTLFLKTLARITSSPFSISADRSASSGCRIHAPIDGMVAGRIRLPAPGAPGYHILGWLGPDVFYVCVEERFLSQSISGGDGSNLNQERRVTHNGF